MLLAVLSAAGRGCAAFFLLLAVTRLMGNKAIAQLTFFDFCIAITIGSTASDIGLAGDDSFASAASVLITLGALALSAGYFHLKSFRFRKLVNSEPIVLIANGTLVETNLKKARLAVTDLTSLLREKDVFRIGDVNFAVLENNGRLSVLLKSEAQTVTQGDLQMALPETALMKELVLDGKILHENLEAAGKNTEWLLAALAAQGAAGPERVLFAALDGEEKLYVAKKGDGREKPGVYGIE